MRGKENTNVYYIDTVIELHICISLHNCINRNGYSRKLNPGLNFRIIDFMYTEKIYMRLILDGTREFEILR